MHKLGDQVQRAQAKKKAMLIVAPPVNCGVLVGSLDIVSMGIDGFTVRVREPRGKRVHVLRGGTK